MVSDCPLPSGTVSCTTAQRSVNTFSKLAHKTVVDDWVADVVDEEEIHHPALVPNGRV